MNKFSIFLTWFLTLALIAAAYVYLYIAVSLAGFPLAWLETTFNGLTVFGLVLLLGAAIYRGLLKRPRYARLLVAISLLVALALTGYGQWGNPYFEKTENARLNKQLRDSLPDRAAHILRCNEGYKVYYINETFGSTGKSRKWLVLTPPSPDAAPVSLVHHLTGDDVFVSNAAEYYMEILASCRGQGLTYAELRKLITAAGN